MLNLMGHNQGTIRLPDSAAPVIAEWMANKARYNALDKAIKNARGLLLAALNGATLGTCPGWSLIAKEVQETGACLTLSNGRKIPLADVKAFTLADGSRIQAADVSKVYGGRSAYTDLDASPA